MHIQRKGGKKLVSSLYTIVHKQNVCRKANTTVCTHQCTYALMRPRGKGGMEIVDEEKNSVKGNEGRSRRMREWGIGSALMRSRGKGGIEEGKIVDEGKN